MPLKDSSRITWAMLWAPSLLYVVLMLGIAWSVAHDAGRLVYPLDDTYIHMAMARHLADHGVYGVSLSGFSATSSAPFWTLLLGAGYRIVGPSEWLPFLFNLFAGAVLVWVFTREWRRWVNSYWAAGVLALAAAAILPLPALTAVGMEHTLHVLLVFLLAQYSISQLIDEERKSNSSLFLLAFFATGLRYESGFVIAPLALLFLLRGRLRESVQLLLGAVVPFLLVGFWQVSHGWFLAPNAIVIKSVLQVEGVDRVQQGLSRLYGQLLASPHLAAPFWAAAFAYFRGFQFPGHTFSEHGVRLFVFLSACLMHCSLASIGWYHRYEAYLLALAVLALAPLAVSFRKWRISAFAASRTYQEKVVAFLALVASILILLIIYIDRAGSLSTIYPRSINIYQQQYQMGLFLERYYQGEAMAANDIGAINFLADIYCLDLVGLGSIEPVLARRQERWSPMFLDAWARQEGARVAILYESWWTDLIPDSWIKVGEWKVERRIAVSDNIVTFYALDSPAAKLLRERMLAFEPELPNGVESFVDLPSL